MNSKFSHIRNFSNFNFFARKISNFEFISQNASILILMLIYCILMENHYNFKDFDMFENFQTSFFYSKNFESIIYSLISLNFNSNAHLLSWKIVILFIKFFSKFSKFFELKFFLSKNFVLQFSISKRFNFNSNAILLNFNGVIIISIILLCSKIFELIFLIENKKTFKMLFKYIYEYLYSF